MNVNEIEQAAQMLLKAESEMQQIAPLTEQFPTITLTNAYQIQALNIENKIFNGEKLIGRKVGLTSLAMQKLLGVNEPDFGCLTDVMQIENGGNIERNKLIQPKVEAEISFVMSQDVEGKDVSIEDLRNCIRGVLPSLEIVDSRIENWRIKIADTIADNGSSALFVIGEEIPLGEIDLEKIEMRLFQNDNQLQSGNGAAVLGNPLNAVLWLVYNLADYGLGLRKGDIILPGALAAAVNANSGDTFTADFDILGKVSANFI